MSSKKKVRQGVRLQVANELKKLGPMLEGEAPTSNALLQVRVGIKKLRQLQERLHVLNEQILEDVSEDELEKELEDTVVLDDRILDAVMLAETLIEDSASRAAHQVSSQNLANTSSSTASGTTSRTVRLPKFQMKKYAGDPMEWQPFWDVYQAAIHDSESLSDVEKFTYLIGYLEGDALSVASGYQLTAANYAEVVLALEERFGDPQRARFAHLEAMLAVPCATHDVASLQKVADQCEVHIRSLNALGLAEDSFGEVFAPIVLSKLPKFVKTELYRKNGRQNWTLENVRTWLKEEIRARTLSEDSFAEKKTQPQHPNKAKQAVTKSVPLTTTSTSALVATGKPQQGSVAKKCSFCSGGHFSDQCSKFGTVESRKAALDQKACFACLQTGHARSACRFASRACFHCRKPGHHRSLCHTKFSATNDRQKLNPQAREFRPSNSDTVAIAQNKANLGKVSFLPTALAIFEDESASRKQNGRLLLDTASSRSYITEEFFRKLRLQNLGSTYASVGRFGSDKRSTAVLKCVRFFVVCDDGTRQMVTATVTPVISCPISRQPIDPKTHPIVKQIKLAEPLKGKPDELYLDVLIGSDYYYDFVNPVGVLRSSNDGPIFISSKLGFLTAGTMKCVGDSPVENTLIMLLTPSAPGDVVETGCCDLERFWRLEETGTKDCETMADEEALQSFDKSVKYVNGRYRVAWPWKTNDPELHDNYQLALGRLRSLYNRMKDHPEVMSAYNDVIMSQLSGGIVEPVPDVPEGTIYYVPHHGVLTPQKTTKVRVVFDASSKVKKSHASLNDCLFRGPVILSDLCGLLLRFRLHPIAMTSDVEKAFLQIELFPDQRDVGRFLWMKDINQPPTDRNLLELRFTRVFFGAVSSPFLLAATIDHHLRKSASPHAKLIRENIYVDNVVTGETTNEKAIEHYQEGKKLFSEASMNLREFYTNSRMVRDHLAVEDQGKSAVPKVLGLSWDTERDQLSCSGLKTADLSEKTFTKRSMSRKVAQTFDPCGWFSPVVVSGKLLIQQIWRSKVGWDEEIGCSETVEKCCKVTAELAQIPEQRVSRFVGIVTSDSRAQLHVFCDASASASAACVYLRVEKGSSVKCSLLFAKTRLAPLQPKQTIPRLELIAVESGVKMIDFVAQELRIDVQKYLWSDSMCVLHWLKKEKLTSRFVRNRVEKIRKAKGVEYRHVSSADNPADLPSRGCTVEYLASCSQWWNGPSWLSKDAREWPTSNFSDDDDLSIEESEEKPTTEATMMAVDIDRPIEMTKYSSLRRLLRVTSYVKRFASNCRLPPSMRQSGPISPKELSDARVWWDKSVQHETLGDKLIPGRGGQLSTLQAYVDSAGLLRGNSRIAESSLPQSSQNPIILPKYHHYTELVIRAAHEAVLHGGVSQTLSELLKTYWVIQGRCQVKRIIKSCRKCRKVDGGPYEIPPPPPLPRTRLDDQCPPFSYVGVDYLGPLWVKEVSGTKRKVWIALFTCAVVRAIHLEVVDSQSTGDFQLALRRFMSVRGTPKVMISDNASQFCVMDQAVGRMKPSIEEFASARLFEWKFIPQVSPWMGGFYERLIGIVKRFLKKCLSGLCVSSSELSTVVSEIAATINSRPLLYIESDTGSRQLCPSDIVGPAQRTSFPIEQGTVDPLPTSTVNRVVAHWKRIQKISDNFWQHWRQGYLTSLRERASSRRQRNASSLIPTVGSVVQIKDKVPRGCWKIGKIQELKKSRDGKIRSVVLKLVNQHEIVRPIKLLYPLEMHQESEEDSPDPETSAAGSDDEDGFEGFSSDDVQRTVDVLRWFNGSTDGYSKMSSKSTIVDGRAPSSTHDTAVVCLTVQSDGVYDSSGSPVASHQHHSLVLAADRAVEAAKGVRGADGSPVASRQHLYARGCQ